VGTEVGSRVGAAVVLKEGAVVGAHEVQLHSVAPPTYKFSSHAHKPNVWVLMKTPSGRISIDDMFKHR
jgi:hypothetical protein